MKQVRLLALLITLAMTCVPIATAGAQCPCDFNGDLDRGGVDLATLLSAWGGPGGDCTDDGTTNGIDLSFLLAGWGPCPSTMILVVPSSGIYSGGTAITITGTNFTGVTSVTVGGAAVTSLVVVSATSITAVTPAGTLGARDVVVTRPVGGTATAVGGFTYTNWYTVLEHAPNPVIVTNSALRSAITATGLPWRVRDNGTNIEMLLIPPGSFTMGCTPSVVYECYSYESPLHTVTLTSAFYLGRYEVTQAQWTAKMGTNPSYF